ncbi:VENN motif pre-toxin domain-containing protein [Neisseria weixii]|uniref:VENN motif pre-toxin domain-containing protein n=1 Tax=Neisseria weixii TaxID=1853276 RepID=UPI0022B76643|nr:VENN motif pre-toxin domain-containing protein [Neisseria weixii]
MNAHPTRTFSSNRQKAAAEDKAKAEAEFEGRLKARNDGSYEAFSRLSDSERQAVLISESEAYRHAGTEARNWGIGGSKSRAVNAGTILLTGILGGKTNLQTAANTLSPYAAAAIGNTFGHGANQNETAQLVGHFVLGATLAYINGGDPLSGGSAAVAAEKAAQYLSQQYNDGQTAIDPQTGEFNPNLLPEQIKEEIKSTTGVIAAIVGATGDGGAALNAQIGGVLGQNAVENNSLLVNPKAELLKTSGCKTKAECERLRQRYERGEMVAAKYIGAPVVDTLLASLFPIYDFGSTYAQAETAEGKMLAFIAIVPFERLGKTAANALDKTVDLLKHGKTSEAFRYFQVMANELKHDNVMLSVAGNGGSIKVPKGEIPSQAVASKPNQYKGGAHSETKKPANDGLDSHHCPAQACYKGAPISSENGPAIQMEPGDHRLTQSYGRSPEAEAYRAKQKSLLNQGKLQEAIDMDVKDIRSKFGSKYDEAINEMLKYSKTLDPESFKSAK